jgi:hypothetical protein
MSYEKQYLAENYNCPILNFDLWFMTYYDFIEKLYPEDKLKEYYCCFCIIENRKLYNFFTDEYYLLRVIYESTNAGYSIIDLHSYQTEKHILSFVAPRIKFKIFERVALDFRESKNKRSKYIYLLTADKLIRFNNVNPILNASVANKLFYVNQFIAYEKNKNSTYLIYSLFEPKYVKIPAEVKYIEHNTKTLVAYNNKNNMYMMLSPFNTDLYLQSEESPKYFNPLKVLI